MTQVIRVPDRLFARLQSHGIPFVDTPADVIERLLDSYELSSHPDTRTATVEIEERGGGALQTAPERTTSERAPRERGVTVEIAGHTIEAVSVRDLYERALKLLVDNGYADRLNGVVPFRTSAERHLVSARPVHPNGREFVVPVQYGGFYMEAHKDYKNGINHLRRLVEKCGLSFNDRV